MQTRLLEDAFKQNSSQLFNKQVTTCSVSQGTQNSTKNHFFSSLQVSGTCLVIKKKIWSMKLTSSPFSVSSLGSEGTQHLFDLHISLSHSAPVFCTMHGTVCSWNASKCFSSWKLFNYPQNPCAQLQYQMYIHNV